MALSGLGHASIVSFIDVDIPIATTFGGTSVNLETGAFANTDSLAGADVNFFFGGTGISNDADVALASPTFQPIRTGTGNTDTVDNRGLGTTVSGANTFSTGFGGSSDHIGSTFTAGVPGYIGFSLQSDDFGLVFGWLEVTLNPNTSEGTIHSWAFDTTGASIIVGAVPEPSSALLAALGSSLLLLRRRR